MVKISNYSKNNLLKILNVFEQKIYLLFYDLSSENFYNATSELSNYLNIIETKTTKIGKDDCLILFCQLNAQKLEELVALLDFMDISEFDISEYQSINEIKLFKIHNSKMKDFRRQIYVNKDEKIIQLYNFF